MNTYGESELISIVIPIYNVEKYLACCIESVIRQTYKALEIILVDDGSTDSCPDICDKYEKIDTRIIVIHKENGGLSDARNAGLAIARGKYITFIDSDDFVSEKFIEELFKAMIQNNSDISVCNYKMVDENATKQEDIDNDMSTLLFSNKEALHHAYQGDIKGFEFLAWGKMYKKALFTENKIEYPKGKIHEDTFTTYKLLDKANTVVYIGCQLYYYRLRQGSIMQSSYNIKHLDLIDATKEACDYFKGSPELLKLAVNNHLRSLLKTYYDVSKKYKNPDRKKVLKTIYKQYKKDWKLYSSYSGYSFGKKIFYSVMYMKPMLFMIRAVKIA